MLQFNYSRTLCLLVIFSFVLPGFAQRRRNRINQEKKQTQSSKTSEDFPANNPLFSLAAKVWTICDDPTSKKSYAYVQRTKLTFGSGTYYSKIYEIINPKYAEVKKEVDRYRPQEIELSPKKSTAEWSGTVKFSGLLKNVFDTYTGTWEKSPALSVLSDYSFTFDTEKVNGQWQYKPLLSDGLTLDPAPSCQMISEIKTGKFVPKNKKSEASKSKLYKEATENASLFINSRFILCNNKRYLQEIVNGKPIKGFTEFPYKDINVTLQTLNDSSATSDQWSGYLDFKYPLWELDTYRYYFYEGQWRKTKGHSDYLAKYCSERIKIFKENGNWMVNNYPICGSSFGRVGEAPKYTCEDFQQIINEAVK